MTAAESAASDSASTNVCVAVHVRPLVDNEAIQGCQECLVTTPGQPQVSTPTNHSFTFDHVFGRDASPPGKLFQQCVEPLVEGLFKGYNATVLAYGQTGSGKTYTMGSAFSHGRATQGVIPQAMAMLFARMQQEADNAQFTVRVGFVEIHKEEIRDLLVHEPENLRPTVTVREAQGGGVCLAGAQEQEVTRYAEMAQVLEQGSLARATASTSMNAHSSRSHAIFTITLEQRKRSKGAATAQASAAPTEDEAEDAEDDVEDEYLCAKMHLVDLAGSERAKRTKAEGQRLKEGIHINKGLLALGNVISALCDEQRMKAAGHVPYRDSKLTRLLQDSLGGNSRTCMIACVSPADINLEETVNTLKYAARARNIRNTPVVNRDASSAQVTHLKQQLAAARAEVACLKKAMHTGHGGGHASRGDDLMQAALEELEAQAASSEKDVERLKVEMESLRKEADENQAAKLAAQAERDVLQHRLHLAKQAGFVEDDEDGLLDQSQLQAQLEKIARLESENRRLKQVTHLSSAYMTARRQSGVGAMGTPASQGPMTPGGPGQSPMPFGMDAFALDFPEVPEEDELEEQARTFEHDRLGSELHKLQSALEEKEQQLMELQARSKVSALKEHYDRVLTEANSEREALSKEKGTLMAKLQAIQASNAENRKRLEQKYRSHIRELETKMKAASRRAAEASRYERLKSRMDDHCKRLQDEIMRMKQQKVALAKAVEQSNKEMNQYKRKRDKELAQVKRAGMKSAAEVQKLSAMHEKQQQVLKRKTEEAEAARRRLRELSNKSGSAASRKPRVDMAATLAKEDHKTEAARREWIEKELEMENQVLDMQRVLDGELALRGECARQLAEIRRQLTAVQHPELLSPGSFPPMATKDGAESEDALAGEEVRLEEAIKEHSRQIALMQDSILKANAEEEAASADKKARDEKDLKRWEFIRTVPEARVMLRSVFHTASTARSLACETDAMCAEVRDELELVRLQHQQAEFEAKMAKRSAAAAEAACAAALANAAVEQQRAPDLAQPSQEDGELAELLQELDSVQVEMTGAAVGGTPSFAEEVSKLPEVMPDSAIALRYAAEAEGDTPGPLASDEEEMEESFEEDLDDDDFDDDDEADPTWDVEQATPFANRSSGRRRGRSSSGSRKWEHWKHPASAAAKESEGLDPERAVLKAINIERSVSGQNEVDRLTVPVLKEYLKGQVIDGVAWKAGQKTKAQLLDDAQALLGTAGADESPSATGTAESTGKPSQVAEELAAAVTPVPTVRGVSAGAVGNNTATPSTVNAQESARRYLQMATAARQRAAALKQHMEMHSSSSHSDDTTSNTPNADAGEVTSAAPGGPVTPLAQRNVNVVEQREAQPKRKLLNPEQHLAAMLAKRA